MRIGTMIDSLFCDLTKPRTKHRHRDIPRQKSKTNAQHYFYPVHVTNLCFIVLNSYHVSYFSELMDRKSIYPDQITLGLDGFVYVIADLC